MRERLQAEMSPMRRIGLVVRIREMRHYDLQVAARRDRRRKGGEEALKI